MPNANPIPTSEMDDVAVGRYVKTVGRAQSAISAGISELRKQRRRAKIADRPWFDQAVSELRSEHAELQANLLALLDERISLAQPTDAEFNAALEAAKELEGLVASAKAAKQILNAATKLADNVQSWT